MWEDKNERKEKLFDTNIIHNDYINKNSYLNNNDFLINIKFFNLENQIEYPIKDLSGLISLCLMKYLSEFFDNDKILENLSEEIKTIIIKLRNNIDFNGDNKRNIYNLLSEKRNNILLISLLNEEKKKKSYIYWGCLLIMKNIVHFLNKN